RRAAQPSSALASPPHALPQRLHFDAPFVATEALYDLAQRRTTTRGGPAWSIPIELSGLLAVWRTTNLAAAMSRSTASRATPPDVPTATRERRAASHALPQPG